MLAVFLLRIATRAGVKGVKTLFISTQLLIGRPVYREDIVIHSAESAG